MTTQSLARANAYLFAFPFAAAVAFANKAVIVVLRVKLLSCVSSRTLASTKCYAVVAVSVAKAAATHFRLLLIAG